MTIIVDSFEYKCWHEVGHANFCLHLGGDVTLIEFLPEGDQRGHARTRTDNVTDEIHRTVASGGFAAEFYLLKWGLAQQDSSDGRDINQLPFQNSTHDMEAFFDRKLGLDEYFGERECRAFMDHAITFAATIFDHYSLRMQNLVAELHDLRRIEGGRVREVLGLMTRLF